MSAGAGSAPVVVPPWLASDVRHHLRLAPRQLPSRALYDELGSTLFDAICLLPWYLVTRAERRLIRAHGREILEAAGAPGQVVELGCGHGEKLDLLLRVAADGASALSPRRIDVVDVSSSALAVATRRLSERRRAIVVPHEQPYEEGLVEAAGARHEGEHLVVMLLGSNIGNFDAIGVQTFLGRVRGTLRRHDTLVLGVDLVKPERDLLLAYDDPLGVTAAFNKNLLVRLNRELGATFDVTAFDHRAVWNAEQSRIEMHLVVRRAHRVDVPGAEISIELREGESIWTESSYKYEVESFEAALRRASFEPDRRWVDQDGQFLLVLAQAH